MAGSKIAASANACCVPTAIEQGGISRKGVLSPSAVRAFSGRVTKQLVASGLSATAFVVLPVALAAAADEEIVSVVLENCTADAEETRVERKRTVEAIVAMFAAIVVNGECQVQMNVCWLATNE